MCGIFLSISAERALHPGEAWKATLQRRGPDYTRTYEHRLSTDDGKPDLHIVFHSTVLALRGDAVTPQPLVSNDDGAVFAWNGEAWRVGGDAVTTNDTETLFRGLIRSRTLNSESEDTAIDHVKQYISTISGPFAFVFLDSTRNRLYFGRDATGRRSLMFHEDSLSLIICSCSNPDDQNGWQEIQPDGIYTLDLNSTISSGMLSMTNSELATWDMIHNSTSSSMRDVCVQTIPSINQTLATTSEMPAFDSKHIVTLKEQLTESLRVRLRSIPDWKQTAPTVTTSAASPSTIDTPGNKGTEKVAVLFSGGLDCTVLARLSHDLLPLDQPIALLNVAFENPRLTKSGTTMVSQYEECPDRITARAALKELQASCPGRQWLFIAINTTYDELVVHRDAIVRLMRPHDTEMDLSIAMALYFASRGAGHTDAAAGIQPYQTRAQVLLSGLGADELFGGYIRHENAFRRGGLEALILELQLDIGRIGTRNLGRDDRVTTHWAREVRYPFLDESLVNWVVGLPVWQKCRFGMTTRDNDVEAAKYLLRRLALEVGLNKTAHEKKRAIQFGTRSAKMFSRKAKGTDVAN